MPARARTRRCCQAIDRLDEIPASAPEPARVILAEIGLDMTPVPHRRAPGVLGQAVAPHQPVRARRTTTGKSGKGDPYLKGGLGEAAAAAARTDTFLGERYRRLARRRGKLRALVAVARSILVIVWHLLADPAARFRDLGPGYYASRTDTDRKTRNHIRQLQALGVNVTIDPRRLTRTVITRPDAPAAPGPLPRAPAEDVHFPVRSYLKPNTCSAVFQSLAIARCAEPA